MHTRVSPPRVIAALAALLGTLITGSATARFVKQETVRFATFNISFNRFNAGDLATELSAPGSAQAEAVAEIIQRTRPDVVLLNEFDYDEDGVAVAGFQDNYLSVSQNGVAPIEYPYVYFAPSNTGIPSGVDLNDDGSVGGPDDAFGFGFFPGQYGMVVLSQYPIVDDEVRTFQHFLWRDMPNSLLPADYYSEQAQDVLRLSSKSHWDVPVNVGGNVVHVLASHPTPPVFDGPEDRNGRRNHDEIRFFADYVHPFKGRYIYDDAGRRGGLRFGSRFVIMGDLNADPSDGDSTEDAILQLLDSPMVNTKVTPESEGAIDAALAQGGANDDHTGFPGYDTADFADGTPGNLRADYVLPARFMRIADAGVFWPKADDPRYELVGDYPFPSSDHRLVWVDIKLIVRR